MESIVFSPSSHAYEGLKLFRDALMQHIRACLTVSLGPAYVEHVKPLAKKTWNTTVKNALDVRQRGLITTPLADELDAFDARIFPEIFKRFSEELRISEKHRSALARHLDDIAAIRNPIGHPGSNDLSKIDAFRALENMMRAASIVLGPECPETKQLIALAELVVNSKETKEEPLDKWLPPKHEVVDSFVGKRNELSTLSAWLISSERVWALVGDGGKGKSALAFTFAQRLTSTENGGVRKVIWLSAKLERYKEGVVRATSADFATLDQALDLLLLIYGDEYEASTRLNRRKRVLEILRKQPALIVLDDVDSLTDLNEDVVEFFGREVISSTASRVLFTSRKALFGLGRYTTVIKGFDFDDSVEYLRARSIEVGNATLAEDVNVRKLHDVTDGSPLYLEEITRLIHVLGISVSEAVEIWRTHAGELARRYALGKQLDSLHFAAKTVLKACVVSNGPVSLTELKSVSGLSDEDIFSAVEDLRKLYFVVQPEAPGTSPQYDINNNLRLLARTILGDDIELESLGRALKQHRMNPRVRRRIPEPLRKAIAEAFALSKSGKLSDSASALKNLLAATPMEGVILSHLARVYDLMGDGYRTDAAEYYEKAIGVRHQNKATYYNATRFYQEGKQYESVVLAADAGLSIFPDDSILILRRAEAAISAAIRALHESGLIANEEIVKRARRYNNVATRMARAGGPLSGYIAKLTEDRVTLEAEAR